MSALKDMLRDSATMLRRQVIHMVRYPLILFLVGMPVVFLLLFVYVLGGTLGSGLGGGAEARAFYLAYLMPGILIMTVAASGQLMAIGVSQDMTEGIMARFRTMAISRSAVLAGHVAANTLQTLLGLAIVLAVSLIMGYRPTADPLRWLGVTAMLTLVTMAVTWLSVGCGLVAKSVESASNLPMPLMLLPMLGSGFVPVESMAAGMRWFAEHQPFTLMIETVRALLAEQPVGDSWLLAVAWGVGLTLVGYVWSLWLYERRATA